MTFDELVEQEVARQLALLIPVMEQRITEKLEKKFHTKVNDKPVTQKEAAAIVGVSETTFRKYRKMGLESEPSPTGKLLFNVDKIRAWQAKNDSRKTK